MAKQKIFFSYSRVDGSAFALKLAVDLKKKGFDVWIDQEDIRAGLDWDTEIEAALESCDCLLFLETEKSVVSNNVLDEVYYALDQKKKVIPLIFVDGKTPYRLNRLQNIDFTKSYDAGLAHLVNELEGNAQAVTYPAEGPTRLSGQNKAPSAKTYRTVAIIAGVAVLIAAVVMLTTKNKNAPSTATRDSDVAVSSVNKSTGPAGPINGGQVNDLNKLAEIVAGDWELMDMLPKAESQNGYLQIEASGEAKATIKAYMQFYYKEKEKPPYVTVFNGFVGCPSCVVNKEMKLKVEDIAVGTANSNKSIRGTATLHFVNDSTAVIKISQSRSVELANGSMLEPFEYSFHFSKSE